MKRLFALLVLPALLAGCDASPVFEQMEDVYAGAVSAPAELVVMLPEEASVMTAAGDGQAQLYFCDGYTLTVQTLSGGDLDRSLRDMTGYGRESLSVVETQRQGLRQIDCAWACAGEGGDQVGRLVLLDDGYYHYVVTVMAPAEQAGALAATWDTLLNRVSLAYTGS